MCHPRFSNKQGIAIFVFRWYPFQLCKNVPLKCCAPFPEFDTLTTALPITGNIHHNVLNATWCCLLAPNFFLSLQSLSPGEMTRYFTLYFPRQNSSGKSNRWATLWSESSESMRSTISFWIVEFCIWCALALESGSMKSRLKNQIIWPSSTRLDFEIKSREKNRVKNRIMWPSFID